MCINRVIPALLRSKIWHQDAAGDDILRSLGTETLSKAGSVGGGHKQGPGCGPASTGKGGGSDKLRFRSLLPSLLHQVKTQSWPLHGDKVALPFPGRRGHGAEM